MTPEWNAFAATPGGTRIFNNGYAQCVAVANLFNEGVLGLPFVQVDSAYQWWTLRYTNWVLAGNYVPSSTPVAGAIVVWAGAGWNAEHGHIGSVLQVLPDGSFITLEQNAGTADRNTWNYHRRVTDAGLQGFLIPSNNPATNAALREVPEEDEDEMNFYFEADGDSSPGKDGISRIKAGVIKIGGVLNSNVWERSPDGRARRLFDLEWLALNEAAAANKRKLVAVKVSGNAIEQMVHGTR